MYKPEHHNKTDIIHQVISWIQLPSIPAIKDKLIPEA